MDYIDIAAAAKLIRSDIAAAIKRGYLPAIKVSVRVSRSNTSERLAVCVESVPAGFAVLNAYRVHWEAANPGESTINAPERARARYSAQGDLLLAKLEQIVDRHNDIVGVDSQSRHVDRNFFTSVSYDAGITTGERERIVAADTVAAPPQVAPPQRPALAMVRRQGTERRI